MKLPNSIISTFLCGILLNITYIGSVQSNNMPLPNDALVDCDEIDPLSVEFDEKCRPSGPLGTTTTYETVSDQIFDEYGNTINYKVTIKIVESQFGIHAEITKTEISATCLSECQNASVVENIAYTRATYYFADVFNNMVNSSLSMESFADMMNMTLDSITVKPHQGVVTVYDEEGNVVGIVVFQLEHVGPSGIELTIDTAHAVSTDEHGLHTFEGLDWTTLSAHSTLSQNILENFTYSCVWVETRVVTPGGQIFNERKQVCGYDKNP